MKHINGPVQICDSEIINLYYIRDADGNRITAKLSLELAREMRDALNKHDRLVKERDALVEACRDVVTSYDREDNIPISGALAALAMVRGEENDD